MEWKRCPGCGVEIEAQFDMCHECGRILRNAGRVPDAATQTDLANRRLAIQIEDAREEREAIRQQQYDEYEKSTRGKMMYRIALFGFGIICLGLWLTSACSPH